MTAGGGKAWIDQVKKIPVGAKLFAYVSGSGYVGLGEVVSGAVPQKDFKPPGRTEFLVDLPTRAKRNPNLDDPEHTDWCLGVNWLSTLERERGVLKNFAR